MKLLFDHNLSPRLVARLAALSSVRGFPPKVIWIRRGNCSTQVIEQILQSTFSAIQAFAEAESICINLGVVLEKIRVFA
ncbi:MAG: hypothetical protein RLZZ511_2898 [Cyanobacteriota bacterium]|jgi:predicted nuclease of predicted toxin-antitoxin system